MTDWRQASAVKGLFVDGASDAHSATATMPPPSRNGEAPFASNGDGAAANAATSNGAQIERLTIFANMFRPC